MATIKFRDDDIIKVIYNGGTYSYYEDFFLDFKMPEYSKYFVKGDAPVDGKTYVVVRTIPRSNYTHCNYIVIQDKSTKQIYIMESDDRYVKLSMAKFSPSEFYKELGVDI